ncbi:MAG TPA: hypothetical protein VFA07_15410 [Chthonomonadaceae bacterium]|nr:hypothetical protein [Chthonomonadaceae bacterium]
MRTQRAWPYGLAAAGLLGLSFLAWFHSVPASAQQEQISPPRALPQLGQSVPPGRPMMPPMFSGATAMTANNNYVYVLRGNTIMALRANDLSFVGQVDLPMPRASQRQQEAPPGAPDAP